MDDEFEKDEANDDEENQNETIENDDKDNVERRNDVDNGQQDSELEGVMFGGTAFDELKDQVSEFTLRAVEEMGFTHMTKIQAKTIPHLLKGR